MNRWYCSPKRSQIKSKKAISPLFLVLACAVNRHSSILTTFLPILWAAMLCRNSAHLVLCRSLRILEAKIAENSIVYWSIYSFKCVIPNRASLTLFRNMKQIKYPSFAFRSQSSFCWIVRTIMISYRQIWSNFLCHFHFRAESEFRVLYHILWPKFMKTGLSADFQLTPMLTWLLVDSLDNIVRCMNTHSNLKCNLGKLYCKWKYSKLNM